MTDLLVLPTPAKSLQNGTGFGGKTLTNWACSKRKIEPPCQKEKEQSRRSKSPNREVGESQGERGPNLGEKERERSGSMGRKGWTPQ